MHYKAVLFDLDGTLLDTLEDLADSMNLVLARLGCPQHDVAAYKYYVGDGVKALVLRALPPDRRDEATVRQCIAAMRQEYGKRWAYKTRPYPGIPELLDTLTQRGIKTAILSNKPDATTQLVVAKLLPRWRFDAVVGQRDSVPLKPDPTAALHIAQTLGLEPTQFIYLGDTGTDMKTACAAGMYPVGALWGFRTADELTANGAKALIKTPLELLKLL